MEQKPRIIVHRKVYDLTHAKHNPAICLTPGLFQSVKPNERKRTKLDITYKYGDKTISFLGYEILDASDMRLLQFLVAMGTHAPTISKPIINVREPHLFPILKTKDQNIINNAIVEGQKKDVIIIKTHIRKLLTEMNITTGGKNFQNIRTRLKRLASITIWVDNEKEEAAYYLLNYKFDKESEMLHIELNNTITNTIIQNTNYTLIELDEIRQLKTAPARLVHQRLCGWINFGKNGTVGMDTLCDYIWTTPTLTHNIKKHRKQVIKKTIEELKSIGWKIWEAEPGQYNIFRVHD